MKNLRPYQASRRYRGAWVVERTFAQVSIADAGNLCLTCGSGVIAASAETYEKLRETSEAFIYLAMTNVILKRLTKTA